MQKKLTITVDEKIYAGLQKVIGRGHISEFIESLVRPHVLPREIEYGYKAMAADKVREAEAEEWIEGALGDGADETR